MQDKLLYRDEVYAIQGALFDVYKTMGNMWGEEVYQQCLEKELVLRKIPYEAKKELPIFYKGPFRVFWCRFRVPAPCRSPFSRPKGLLEPLTTP